MAIKLVLTAEEIGNKIFKGVARGYDPYEVDKYLDEIISDYEKVESNFLLSKAEVDSQKKKIESLESRIKELELEIGRYKTKYSNIKPTDSVTDENINYLKRINALERFLWQNGFNPNNIK